MPLSSVAITGDIADQVGSDFDSRRTKVWVTTNVPDDTVIDTDGKKIRLGSGSVTLNSDGTFSASVWVPGTGSSPASWQTYFHVDYPDAATRTRRTRTFGPFTITVAADLADLVEQQEVPPTYLSTVTAQLDTYVTEAEAARDAAVDISNIDTSDGVVSALVEGTGGAGPLTRSALSASIDGRIPAVVLRGDDIDLTGTTDSTAALQTLITTSIADGARRFVGVPGATYKVTMVDDGYAFSITADGVTFDLSSSTIDNTAYVAASNSLTPVFLVDGAKDFTLRLRRYVGYTLPDPLNPTTGHGYRGAILVRAINGANNITVDARCENIRYGVQSGQFGDATKGGCYNFDIKITGTMVGYPIALYRADHIRHDIDVDGVHRVAYIGGCRNVRGTARFKDQYIADTAYLITDALTGGTDALANVAPPADPTTSRGCEDIDVTVIDKGSTVYQDSTQLAGITLSRVDPCSFRNIKVRGYAGSSTVGTSQRTGLFTIASGAKTTFNRYAFNWEPHIVIENIDVGGCIDHSSQTGEGSTAGVLFCRAYESSASHAATIRNLTYRDLVIKQSPGNTRQLVLEALGLAGVGALFENVTADNSTLDLYTNATAATTFRRSSIATVNNIGVTGGGRIEMVDSAFGALTDSVTGNTAAMANVANVGGSSVYGATERLVTRHYLVPLTGAGSQTWTNAIPSGALIQSVSGRVIDAITGTGVLGFAVGVSGDVGRYYNANTLTAGTTFTPTNANATGQVPHRAASTLSIVVTARTSGGPDGASNFTGGTLRLVVRYWLPVAPTA